jgi:hypothetical protein
MGTPIEYQQNQQLLTKLVEKRGKRGVNFLKTAGSAGTTGRLGEWISGNAGS